MCAEGRKFTRPIHDSRVSFSLLLYLRGPVRRLLPHAWLLLAAPGVLQIVLVAVAVAGRVAYPYDLEWMEGGMLNHALRLSEGHSLYAPPSIDFIPYLYTPLYPALLAALGKVFGLSYVLGRAVSVVSLLAVFAFMLVAVVREAPRRGPALAAGLLAVGFVAATYPWFEGWYDLVRGDTLFLAMAVGGLALLRAGAHRLRWVAMAAAILGLSFFCKQTGLLLVVAGGAALLFMNWRALPLYTLIAGAIGGGGSLLLDRLTGGWYWIYVFEVHQQHETHMPRFWKSFANMAGQLPVLTAVLALGAIAVVVHAVRQRRLPDGGGALLYWLWMTAVGALIGALGWATQWAHFNAYIPAMTFAAIAAALVVIMAARWHGAVAAGLAVVLGAQLVIARWSPSRFVPKDEDRKAGDALVARLATIPGEIFMPSHPWYPHLAGKPTFTHRMGIMDVTYRPPASEKKKVLRPEAREVAGLAEALRAGRFAAVVLDDRYELWELPGLTEGYHVDAVLPRSESPRVVSGAHTVPRQIWVREDRGPPPPGTRVIFDFEGRDWKDWTVTGDAWGRGPTRGTPGQPPVGWRGAGYASSQTIGDKGTGTLLSPRFTLAGARLTLRVGGGTGPGVRAELRDAASGQVLRTARGVGGLSLAPVTWAVGDLRGREVQLALVDEEKGIWGIVWVDDLREEGVR